MCRWCAAPMRCGASSRPRPARPLLHVTGIAEIGPPDGALVNGTLAAARLHDIPHELIAAPELMRRYPAFRLPPHYVGVVQPDGGFVEAEAVRASDAGAGADSTAPKFASAKPCARSSRRATGVRIVTDGATIEAGAAIVAAGPWIASLLPGAALPLRVTRQVMGWFAPTAARRLRARPLPGVPDRKRARHPLWLSAVRRRRSRSRSITIATRRSIRIPTTGLFRPTDEALIRAAVADHLPGANGPLVGCQDLPLHRRARRRFHHRPAARRGVDRRRIALLRSRLQVRAGDRRNSRRSRHRASDRARHFAVPDRPLRVASRPAAEIFHFRRVAAEEIAALVC